VQRGRWVPNYRETIARPCSVAAWLQFVVADGVCELARNELELDLETERDELELDLDGVCELALDGRGWAQ
jgi:hypothetical protein